MVTGCLAERYQQEIAKELPEVNAVVGIGANKEIARIVREALEGKRIETFRPSASFPWRESGCRAPQVIFLFKNCRGCDNHCTYCAIPLIRGDNVSYPLEQLIAEAKQLASQGVKELVLIAQDTTKYGVDLYGKGMLLTLLEQLEALGLFHWIRVLYMYPDEIDEALIKGMAKLPHVLPILIFLCSMQMMRC